MDNLDVVVNSQVLSFIDNKSSDVSCLAPAVALLLSGENDDRSFSLRCQAVCKAMFSEDLGGGEYEARQKVALAIIDQGEFTQDQKTMIVDVFSPRWHPRQGPARPRLG